MTKPMKMKPEADKACLLEWLDIWLDNNNQLDLPGLHPHFEYNVGDCKLAYGEVLFDVKDAVSWQVLTSLLV